MYFNKILLAASLLLATSLLLFSSCSKEDDDNSSNNNSNQAQQTVTSGEWSITEFIDSGQDETSDFNGFTFTFESNGNLVATNGSTTYTGSWSIDEDNSDDDSSDDDDFIINFNLTNDFEDLNDDWDIESVTDSKIDLIDISGGNGGTDYLTFEKI